MNETDVMKAANSVWRFEAAYQNHIKAQAALVDAQKKAQSAQAAWQAVKAARELAGLMPISAGESSK